MADRCLRFYLWHVLKIILPHDYSSGDRNVSVVDTNFTGRLGPFQNDGEPSAVEDQLWTTGFSESDRGYSRCGHCSGRCIIEYK